MTLDKLVSCAALLTLLVLAGCKGSGTSVATPAATPTATSLAYTNPTSGTYLLTKNTTLTTATHLVLDLTGPAATTGSGVSATFSADTTKVTWTKVSSLDSTYVEAGGTFNLGTTPQILKGKIIGSTLQVAAAQKGTGSPVALNAPLLRIALDLNAAQPVGSVALAALSTNHQCQVLDSSGNLTDIVVTVGTLAAQ